MPIFVMTTSPVLKTQRMQIGGMDCTSCAMKIEGAVEKLDGVAEISVVVATGRLIVTYDPEKVSEVEIKQRVTSLGYVVLGERSQPQPVCDHSGHDHSNHDHSEHDHSGHNSHNHSDVDDHAHNHGDLEVDLRRESVSVGVVIALFVLGSVFEVQLHNTPFAIGEYLVFISAYLLSGWTVLSSAGRNILRGQVFDENFLMTIATLGAIAIHKLPEAVGVMLFFKIGELFQEVAVSRSRRSISALLEIRPDAANLKTANGIQVVSPEQVRVGDTIIIKPGEKIPLDGEWRAHPRSIHRP